MRSQFICFETVPKIVTLADHWVQFNSLNSVWQQLLLLLSVISKDLGWKFFKSLLWFFFPRRVLSDTFLFLWNCKLKRHLRKSQNDSYQMFFNNSVVEKEVNCWHIVEKMQQWRWENENISHIFRPIRAVKSWLLFSYFDRTPVLLLIHEQNVLKPP